MEQQDVQAKQVGCMEKTYRVLCCVKESKYRDPYSFDFNGHDKNPDNEEQFESNFVRTSKYTPLSFLPKALLLQFKRLANVYFLIIAILQSIPGISPLSPITAWIPLIIVLAISMLREGYQDFQRYKSDREVNGSQSFVRRAGKFQKNKWSQIVVGDIVKIEQQQLFPADMLLFTSSTEGGTAFIETASLDGQKNLKPRSAWALTQRYENQAQLDKLQGQCIQADLPNKQLHKFSTRLTIGGETISYDGDKQLLYRGTRLKNTHWVYGLVIYTGRNTKIMQNAGDQVQKMSQIQRKVNRILVFILLVQLVCSFIIAIFYGIFSNQSQSNNEYILWPNQESSFITRAGQAVLIFFTYFVLINTMIPISLIVSIQIVKFAQSIFINKDKLMYSQARKKYVQVKSASLNEQLGQIEYVFSDKTGTLTKNIMEFKIAVIGRQMYGDLALISDDPNAVAQQQKDFRDQKLKNLIQKPSQQQANPAITVKDRDGRHSINFKTQKQLAEEYLKALALAHEVVVETDKKGNKFYQGPSPDEITLVNAAKDMNIEFIKANQSTSTISIRGTQKKYDLLESFSFSSERKRMSVIVKDEGVIKLYIKGADNVIKERLAKDQTVNLDSQLNRFARIGLRTLLIGMRIISEDQYDKFKKAAHALGSKDREAKLAELVSDLQQNLYLIGATAVLDRLQDDVPETIRDLLRANIKVWMLTGDKMQTAQNIAKSCNLIPNRFKILRYEPEPGVNTLAYLKGIVQQAEQYTEQNQAKAFLIEGAQLGKILGKKHQEQQKQFANLAKNCEAVVCCRLQPKQKAQVVEAVRRHLNKITLSIGDGANDVPMIKAAHIGVGLFGEQGMGAVQASDYALPQFRMLWRLLLVHGRWNYMRISEMILYFFYKNMLFTVPQLVFAFYNGYSGQTAFDDYYIALYNMMFTAAPLVFRAVLEQDISYYYKQEGDEEEVRSSALLIRNPTLAKQNKYLPPGYRINKYFYRLFPKIYFIGQENCIFNYSNFFMWILEGVVEAIVITIFTIYIIGQTSLHSDGYSSGWWLVGLTVFSCIIIIVTFKLATHTKFWSWSLFSTFVTTLLSYVVYMWISNYTLTYNITGTTFLAWTTAEVYFLVLFVLCAILAIDGAVVFLDFDRGGYASKMRQIVRAEQQLNKAYLQEVSIRLSENLSVKPQQ